MKRSPPVRGHRRRGACIFITGQSNYVSSMKAISYVYNYPVLEHVQLYGPSVNYNTAN